MLTAYFAKYNVKQFLKSVNCTVETLEKASVASGETGRFQLSPTTVVLPFIHKGVSF